MKPIRHEMKTVSCKWGLYFQMECITSPQFLSIFKDFELFLGCFFSETPCTAVENIQIWKGVHNSRRQIVSLFSSINHTNPKLVL